MGNWFSADKDGLRQVGERLVERRGYGILGGELYQNAADTDAKQFHMNIEPIEGRPAIKLICWDDNPTGFKNLTHAWTIFAPSEKKSDPTKAGRFNLGEKMVLAFCREAEIFTTSGTVMFNSEGRHEFPRRKNHCGTTFSAIMDCTRERMVELIEYMDRILVRPGLKLVVNAKHILPRKSLHQFMAALPTEVGDDLRPTVRNTEVEVYAPMKGETAMLYELGIPVVETGDKWHVNVLQKVPLNVDRDNVTPAYLRKVRVAVMNEMFDELEQEDTTSAWVKQATEDKDINADAMKTVMDKQWGPKRVAADPNNPDANAAALVAGYSILQARSISPEQRENAKRFGLLTSSSVEFPHVGRDAYSDDPTAEPVLVYPPGDWTDGMALMYDYTKLLGERLIGFQLTVEFVDAGNVWAACFGKKELHFNVKKLGRKWFDQGPAVEVHRLLIHEFAHHYVQNHATDEFHNACCRLGAKMVELALNEPEFFGSWEARFSK